MLIVFIILPFFLVNAQMDSRVKAAFKQLNRQHNPNIKWSDELEQKALEYLDPDHKMMVIKGQKIYPKNNTLELGIKLYKAFGSDVWKRKGEVAALKGGSQYGCNIDPKKDSEDQLILRYACIYIKN